jgi:hypothetical protein
MKVDAGTRERSEVRAAQGMGGCAWHKARGMGRTRCEAGPVRSCEARCAGAHDVRQEVQGVRHEAQGALGARRVRCDRVRCEVQVRTTRGGRRWGARCEAVHPVQIDKCPNRSITEREKLSINLLFCCLCSRDFMAVRLCLAVIIY